MMTLDHSLNYQNSKVVLKAGLSAISQGENEINCAPLKQFDSSALAVFLAWQRAALKKKSTLVISNVPTTLLKLAQAYGVNTLLFNE